MFDPAWLIIIYDVSLALPSIIDGPINPNTQLTCVKMVQIMLVALISLCQKMARLQDRKGLEVEDFLPLHTVIGLTFSIQTSLTAIAHYPSYLRCSNYHPARG